MVYKNLQKHLQAPSISKTMKKKMEEDYQLRKDIILDSEPLMPADVFLYPSLEILSEKHLKAVVPQFCKGKFFAKQIFEDIVLPFDKDEYYANIHKTETELSPGEKHQIVTDEQAYASKFGIFHERAQDTGGDEEDNAPETLPDEGLDQEEIEYDYASPGENKSESEHETEHPLEVGDIVESIHGDIQVLYFLLMMLHVCLLKMFHMSHHIMVHPKNQGKMVIQQLLQKIQGQ